MDHNIVGWSLFGSLLLVVVLSILAVLQSHRCPKAARVKKLGRYCSYGLAAVVLLNLAAFIWSLISAPAVAADAAGRATRTAMFVAEGMNTLAFMLVSLLIPAVCTIYLKLRARHLARKVKPS
jgi:hypothetical protein